MHHHQRTLKRTVEITGIGLHTGRQTNLTIRPLPADSGINFRRVDLPGEPVMKASWENVHDTSLATSLGRNGYRIGTIEHLMAAFAGLCIDNALVEMDSSEVPIMDGSSLPYVRAMTDAGIKNQAAPKRYLAVKKPIKLEAEDRLIHLYPAKKLEIEYFISFDHPLLTDQNLRVNLCQETFIDEISPARTFGFLSDVNYLRQNGFALGGSLENAVVLDDFRVLNSEGLRFEDEFVRHKILDLLGDLYLMGVPIVGKFKVVKAGHALVHQFLRKLAGEFKHYRIEPLGQIQEKRNTRSGFASIGYADPMPA